MAFVSPPGVVLFGKSAGAAREITTKIAEGGVHKCYLAKVSGEFPNDSSRFRPPSPLEPPAAPMSKKPRTDKLGAGGGKALEAVQEYTWRGDELHVKCPMKLTRGRKQTQ